MRPPAEPKVEEAWGKWSPRGHVALRALMVTLSILLAGCVVPPGPAPGPAPETGTNQSGTTGGDPPAGSIGPSGGTVSSVDGRLSLEIPAGALAAPVVVTASPSSVDLGGNATSLAAYSFGPAGTQFAKPATATLRLPTTADQRASGLPLAFPVLSDPNGLQALENVTLRLDGETLVATAEVRHFTDVILYSLGATAFIHAPEEVGVDVPFYAAGGLEVVPLSYSDFNSKLRGISYVERPVAPITVRGTLESTFGPPVAEGAPFTWSGSNTYECVDPGEGFLSYTIHPTVRLTFPSGEVTGTLDVDVGHAIRCRTGAVGAGATLVGPEGGTVVSADGQAALVVPPGAVSEPTEMNVVEVDAPAPGGEVDPRAAYALQPEGLELAQPARFQIRSGGASPPALARPGPAGLEPLDDVTSTLQSNLEDVIAESTAQRLGRYVVVGSAIRVETTPLFPEYSVGAPIDVMTTVFHRDEGGFMASQEHVDRFAADVAPTYSDAPAGSVGRRGPMGTFAPPIHLENVTAPTLRAGAAAVLRCAAPGVGSLQVDVRFALRLRDGAGNVLGFDNQRATFTSDTRCVAPAGSTMIGAAGGSVTSADGQFALEIPSGALSGETAVSVAPAACGGAPAATCYTIGPKGVQLAQPATATFTRPAGGNFHVPLGPAAAPGEVEITETDTTQTQRVPVSKFDDIHVFDLATRAIVDVLQPQYNVGAIFVHGSTLVVFSDKTGFLPAERFTHHVSARAITVTPGGGLSLYQNPAAFGEIDFHGDSGLKSEASAQYRCSAPGGGSLLVRMQLTMPVPGSTAREVEFVRERTTMCVEPPGPPPTPGFERADVPFGSTPQGLNLLPRNWGPFTSEGGIALIALETGWTAVDVATGASLHTENFGTKYYSSLGGGIASDGTGFIVAAGSFDWRLTPFSGETFGVTETTTNSGSFQPFGPTGGLIRENSALVMLEAQPGGVVQRTTITTRLPDNRFLSSAFPLSPTGPILATARDPDPPSPGAAKRYFVWWIPGLDPAAGVKSAIDLGTSAGDLSCLSGICSVPDFGTSQTHVFMYAPDGTLTRTHTRAGTIGVRASAESDDKTAFFETKFSTDELTVLRVDAGGAPDADFVLAVGPACDGPRNVDVARNVGGEGWHVLVVVCDGNDRIAVSEPFRVGSLTPASDLFPPPPPS